MATITVTLEGRVVQELALHKERITIGRRPHNDIVLDMRAVSAEHAAIITILHDSFLEDLDSTNGTQVNGQPVRKHFLQNHDVIQLAKYQIRYSAAVAPSEAAVNGDAVAFANTVIVQDDPAMEVPNASIAGDSHDTAHAHTPTIRILNGPLAGEEMAIVKSLTTIGRPGVQVAVITRRPHGYLVTHVEGDSYPLVDGVSIGSSAHPIVSGDIIGLSGTEMRFSIR